VGIYSGEAGEALRKITNRERVNLLAFWDRERAQGCRRHDAEGPFGSDEQALEVQARRRPHRGTRSDDAPVREDRLEAEHLVAHRTAEVSAISDPVRPDRSAQGRARPGPRIVTESQPSRSEEAIQGFQHDAGLCSRAIRGPVDRANPAHPL